MRVFSAALATETNTFAPMPTGLASFRERGYYRAGTHPDHMSCAWHAGRRRVRRWLSCVTGGPGEASRRIMAGGCGFGVILRQDDGMRVAAGRPLPLYALTSPALTSSGFTLTK
jgi:hypothetical protein